MIDIGDTLVYANSLDLVPSMKYWRECSSTGVK